MTVVAGREEDFEDIQDDSNSLSNASLHMTKIRSSQRSLPPLCSMGKIGITVAKIDQEELRNCKVDLAHDGLGGGFIHMHIT